MSQVRVAHVITRMIIGGAQENTLYTVLGLHDHPDYDVDLITGPTVGPEGVLLQGEHIKKLFITVVPSLRREINVVRDMAALFSLWRLFRRNRYDIVHTHSSKAGVIGRLAAKLAGVPLIIHTIHGLPFHPYQSSWRRFLYVKLERLAGRLTDRIITVCHDMTTKAVNARIAPVEIFETVYSGIDIAKFRQFAIPPGELRRKLHISPENVVVGKVGRLFPLKGHDTFLKMARTLLRQEPTLKFLIIGDGILREDLMETAKRYGVLDHIVFTGLVSPLEISSYINIMDVLVHVSLREGLPRAIPQAMLLGKPVVCFDLDGSHEVVVHDKTGYLVSPNSPAALNKAVLDLAQNLTKARYMGSFGRDLLANKFDKDFMVERIERLYDEELEKRHLKKKKGFHLKQGPEKNNMPNKP